VSVGIESSLYYLIVQGREDDAIYIFLGSDPAEGSPDAPIAMPVSLELLPTHVRFGGDGSKLRGMPILGRWPGGLERFRQFGSLMELEQAGWLPVTKYRICDSWDDYYSPWSAPRDFSSNDCDGIGQMEVDGDVETEDDLQHKSSIVSTISESISNRSDLENTGSKVSKSFAGIGVDRDTGHSVKGESLPPPSSTMIDIGFIIEDDFNLSMYAIDLGR
jgi:hypothetical protein